MSNRHASDIAEIEVAKSVTIALATQIGTPSLIRGIHNAFSQGEMFDAAEEGATDEQSLEVIEHLRKVIKILDEVDY